MRDSDDPNFLRHVVLKAPSGASYHLRTWDSGRVDGLGKTIIRYEFKQVEKGQGGAYRHTILFSGSDFACSPMDAIDSDRSVGALLHFLTLRPGDTDREYFDDYNFVQHDFAQSSDCEYLQYEVSRRFGD